MNIAWLTPEIPYPPIGGRNGVYNRIVQLSKYNTIYLFSIAYSEEEKNMEKDMSQYCAEVHYYNRNESRIKTIIKSMFVPYSVASRTLPKLREDLSVLFKKQKIDIVIVDFPNMAKNLIGVIPESQYCTLNQHNIEFQRMRDLAKVKTIPYYKRLAYYLESLRLEAYEKSLYNKDIFNSITFFSKDDMIFFKNKWISNKADLKCFPLGANGFDVEKKYDKKHNLLFVGRLDDIAIPNVEAVQWFCDFVFDNILKEIPDAKLIVAGANPSEKITKYSGKNVQIIPNYKDLQDVYSLADCVILPLQSGGGVKGKLLEAIALKKIVITTKHGIEGTDFVSEKHVLYADDPVGFARMCIDALSDKEKYSSMVCRAYSLFESTYEWNSIGKNYNGYLRDNVGYNKGTT